MFLAVTCHPIDPRFANWGRTSHIAPTYVPMSCLLLLVVNQVPTLRMYSFTVLPVFSARPRPPNPVSQLTNVPYSAAFQGLQGYFLCVVQPEVAIISHHPSPILLHWAPAGDVTYHSEHCKSRFGMAARARPFEYELIGQRRSRGSQGSDLISAV